MCEYGGFQLTIREDKNIENIIRDVLQSVEGTEQWLMKLEYDQVLKAYIVDDFETEISCDAYDKLIWRIAEEIILYSPEIRFEGYSHFSNKSDYEIYQFTAYSDNVFYIKMIDGFGLYTPEDEKFETDADEISECRYIYQENRFILVE